MAYQEQTLEQLSGLEKKVYIQGSAFASPLSPSDNEVFIWASAHIIGDDNVGTFIVYGDIDSNDTNFKYIWWWIKAPNLPAKLLRLKEETTDISLTDPLLINGIPIDNPLPDGNTDNLNKISTSLNGQHWVIDKLGNSICLNVSEGDFEVTSPDKGFVTIDDKGVRWRTRTLSDGSHITEKVI